MHTALLAKIFEAVRWVYMVNWARKRNAEFPNSILKLKLFIPPQAILLSRILGILWHPETQY